MPLESLSRVFKCLILFVFFICIILYCFKLSSILKSLLCTCIYLLAILGIAERVFSEIGYLGNSLAELVGALDTFGHSPYFA